GAVLDHLVLDHAHLRLGDRGRGEAFGVAVAGLGDGFDDPRHRRLVVVGVGGRGEARPLEQLTRVGYCAFTGHGFLRPVAASFARPTATSTRSSTSSQRSRLSSRPGLNCRTRGSSVEKIAHTPFWYSSRITNLAPSGWSNSSPITTPFCRMPTNQPG